MALRVWWMRFGSLVVAGLLVAAAPARAVVGLSPSPYLETVPDPACDLVVTPANAGTTFYQFNNPAYRVICVDPGDYRPYGGNTLNASGTSALPRYLRFNGAGAVKAFERTPQALFERLDVRGSWWVVQGLTLRPQSAGTVWILSLTGADRVVLDGNLIDAIEHPNGAYQAGVHLQGLSGNPASDNTIQRNVIRNGDQSHLAADYAGVSIAVGNYAGEDNDRNEVLDNEIADWGDGIALNGWSSTCSEPGRQHGTVIDGNDVYLTSAKYVDCVTGVADPEGGCACAENGIDIKSDPGANIADWTRVTRNRVWGYRPTTEAVVCGGSGAIGQALTAGSDCPGHVFVARNLIADSTIGIDVAGSNWILAGNLLHDIQPSDGHIYGTLAFLLGMNASDIDIQWNTVVSAMNAYDDRSDDTDTRCNVVLDSPEWIGPGQPRGTNHVTEYNYLFQSGYSNLTGPTNGIYASLLSSSNATLCYKRRRWTAQETICVPYGGTAGASPQRNGAPYCNAAIGASFGMPTIDYWVNQTTGCGVGGEIAVVVGGIGWWGRRRRKASRSRLPVALLFVFAPLPLSPTAFALDATRRDFVDCGAPDGGNGSWGRPWNTLAQASAVPLTAGSRLLLRRGSTCVGTLAPQGSGSAAAPAAIASYGDGPAPHILGQGEDAMLLRNVSHVVVQDLELENRGDFETRRRGLHLVADGVEMRNVTVRRLFIHDIEGDLAKDGGGSGGIQVDGYGGGRYDGLLLEHNRIEDVSRSGIFINADSGARPRSGEPWPAASAGIVIRGNQLARLGGDGIVPVGTLGTVIEDNVVSEGNLRGRLPNPPLEAVCNAGIWAFHSNDTLIQRNEVYGMAFNGCDGTGYDIDYDQDGTVIQYNYSHDNEGGFVLLCTDTEVHHADVRFNLSVDDGWAILTAPCAFPRIGNYEGVRVYGNTIVGPRPLAHLEGVQVPFLIDRRTLEFRNNIVVATEPQTAPLPCSTTRCSHNLYFGLPPAGTDAVTADPLFVAPALRGLGWRSIATGFKLRVGSPAIGTGVSIPDSAPFDFFGHAIPATAPAIGFHQP